MNSSGHLPVSETAARPVRRQKRKPRAKATRAAKGEIAPVSSLTRTKTLLLAAIKVWELKRRLND